jgi:hypothetical protein
VDTPLPSSTIHIAGQEPIQVSRTRGPVITERISAQTESWGSGGQLLTQEVSC